MRTKVTENGVLIPKMWLEGIDMAFCLMFIIAVVGFLMSCSGGGGGDKPEPPTFSWSINLSADKTSVTAGTHVTLTATVNRNIDSTGFLILIFEDNTRIQNCAQGTTCSTSSSITSTAGTKNYIAKVARADGSDVQETSNTVSVTWSAPPPSIISLSASATNATFGSNVTLTANVNRDVGPTDFFILIFEGNSIIKTCDSGTTCSTSVVSNTSAITKTYVAKVAKDDGTDVRATSTTVSVTWSAPTITLSASATSVATGTRVTLTATPNQNITQTTFHILIYDGTTLLRDCGGSETTCSTSVGSSTAVTKTYNAKIAFLYRTLLLSHFETRV